MSGSSTKGISSPSRGSILDRVQPQTQSTALSESQSEVNQLVGNAISTVSDEKMMASLFTAGLAGRFIRLGTVATTGKSLVPIAVQGLSHATALAGESAVFAGTERKFAEWGGHARTQLFQKDWARAAINLGSIKLFGGVAAGQNLITQHFLIDSAMVAGHHAGYAFGVTDKPQGTLAQQMIHAEGMNLGMKGSLALLHGFSPRLSAMERSLDLTLKSYETKPFSENPPISFSPRLAWAAEGNSPTANEGLEPNPSKQLVALLSAGGVGAGGGSQSGKVTALLQKIGPTLDQLPQNGEWHHKTEQQNEIAAGSHLGIGYKDNNEDRYYFSKNPGGNTLMVAIDGLGGHDGGE